MTNEMSLVLLGQQAVISNPSVAMLRVSGKNVTQTGKRFFRNVKSSRSRESGHLAPSAFPKHSLGSQIKLSPALSSKTQPIGRVGKLDHQQPLGDRVPLNGDRVVNRRRSTHAGESGSTNTSANPEFLSLTIGGQSSTKTEPSPYSARSRASRSFSAGSIRLHQRAKSSDGANDREEGKAQTQGQGQGQGRVGMGPSRQGSRRRRNMSCTSITLNERQREPRVSERPRSNSLAAQVDVDIRESRSRSQTPGLGGEKRRLRSSNSFNRSLEPNQRQKRLNTAEMKARQQYMEEFCLVQQQKAILRVEERRKHAAQQRHKAELEQQERRHKARERYRLREAEQERRRKHIYALNSIMRQIESRCFEAFKETMEKKPVSSNDPMTDTESESDERDSEESEQTTTLACKI